MTTEYYTTLGALDIMLERLQRIDLNEFEPPSKRKVRKAITALGRTRKRLITAGSEWTDATRSFRVHLDTAAGDFQEGAFALRDGLAYSPDVDSDLAVLEARFDDMTAEMTTALLGSTYMNNPSPTLPSKTNK